MADMANGGTYKIEKWMISVFVLAIGGLCSVIWTTFAAQTAEVRADIRVLQTQNNALNKEVSGLTTRIQDLVDTINNAKRK